MGSNLQNLLNIPYSRLDDINTILLNPDSLVIKNVLEIIEKYGTPVQINQKGAKARELQHLLKLIEETKPDYLEQLSWLRDMRDQGKFIKITDYRQKILGEKFNNYQFNDDFAVTLEISAAQYFPWIIAIAEKAIKEQSIIPGRFIKVRKMKEQEMDGDLPAITAAMQIIGASYVETLDTKGTDGSNVHLDGPNTITGYFGGIGQPNEYPLKWLDEFLYYYTNFGVQQVLNINPGTVLIGYLLYKLGVDIEFKISVFMGNDNPYAALWTLIGAKLFSRDDGTSPLIGFNWSNSINNETMEITAQFRKDLGFEEVVRFEHHILETWKSIVRQPYNRREELIQIAGHVANISAKHEGGEPQVEQSRIHPSDILDYFRDKQEIVDSGDWYNLQQNFLDKFDSTNFTARALTENGLSFIAARKLHHQPSN